MATLFLVGNKYGKLALQVWRIPHLREQKVVMNFAGLDPGNRCVGEAHRQLHANYRPILFVRDGTPHKETLNCLRVIEIWTWAPDVCSTQSQTGRLTVGCNTTSTSNSLHFSIRRNHFHQGRKENKSKICVLEKLRLFWS